MPELPLADRHETELPPVPAGLAAALTGASDLDPDQRRAALGRAVAAHPTQAAAWAALSAVARDDVERYAYARVGYHRGLDALRAAGWGGRGYVRWSVPGNRPFLTCLVHLRDAAAAIGEDVEVARIRAFLVDLDPEVGDVEAVPVD
ncbi:MAG: DUF3151 family protein [Nitriliruptoraceae bacterium]